jgi:amidase
MTPIAHASDGLGSIRIPAACCGLVGLKTTRDRNPNGPDDYDRAIGFVVDHVVSRTVRDSAAMLDATGYPEPASPYAAPAKERPYLDEVGRDPGRLRVAWSAKTPSGRPIHPEVRAALEATAKRLEGLGHDVDEQDLEVDQRALFRAQGRLSAANFAAAIQRWTEIKGREPEDDIGPLARRTYEAGKRVTGIDALRGFQDLRALNRQILSLFEKVDIFLTPVLGVPVPRIDALDPLSADLKAFDRGQAETFPFTPPFNFTGQPSMSLPLCQSADGLPIGMMLTAGYADEGALFRLAGQLEREAPWIGRRPSLAA